MPKEQISGGSVIGRRLFGAKPETSSSLKCSPRWFRDTRLPSNLSVDLLGIGQVDKSRTKRLTVHADSEAAAGSSTFEGWVAILLKNLRAIKVIPNEVPNNPFHAEIDRTEVISRASEHHFATSLAWSFQEHGFFVPPNRSRDTRATV